MYIQTDTSASTLRAALAEAANSNLSGMFGTVSTSTWFVKKRMTLESLLVLGHQERGRAVQEQR
jgi:di/tricarboxylate transporter